MRNAIASTIAVRGRVIHDCRKAGDVRPRRLTAWGSTTLVGGCKESRRTQWGYWVRREGRGMMRYGGMPEVHEAGLSR